MPSKRWYRRQGCSGTPELKLSEMWENLAKSRTARSHHSAAVNVGNLRRRISAVRQDESAKYFFPTARVVSRSGSAAQS
jgi:hypothetical protein